MTQWVWERKAETGRHISLPLWYILQGYRSQSAWYWLSWTCYESIAGWRWSITLGGGSWGEKTARGLEWGEHGRGSPVACHSPCTAAWPPTLSGLCTMGGLELDYEQLFPAPSSPAANEGEGQKKSKHSGQALVLYRPWKTSLLEAAEWWISALFPHWICYFGKFSSRSTPRTSSDRVPER